MSQTKTDYIQYQLTKMRLHSSNTKWREILEQVWADAVKATKEAAKKALKNCGSIEREQYVFLHFDEIDSFVEEVSPESEPKEPRPCQ